MSFEYVVVQAGGRGSRMGTLTANKPKALVTVDNLPIIFHLFKKYPDKKFIIIGDYKSDVLEKYLSAFATVDHVVVKCNGSTGTCAGISEALTFIPEKKSFMLIWSDIVLSDSLEIPEATDIIGISDRFVCRWQYSGGRFYEKTACGHGVAGVFVFSDKSRLDNIPESGEFVRWLSQSNLSLEEFNLENTMEFGTPDAFKNNNKRCRPFNRITVEGDKLYKVPQDELGALLSENEINWYKKASALGVTNIPQIYSFSPLCMEYINGRNVYELSDFAKEEKSLVLEKIISSLKKLHSLEVFPADCDSYYKAYIEKTFQRLEKVRQLVPYADQKSITINGRKCRNVFFVKDELISKVMSYIPAEFAFIHGDCTFSNIIIDSNNEPVLIDPRGYFGECKLYGDPAYDWVKLYYSVFSNYDRFNLGKYLLEIEEEIRIEVESNGWEDLESIFFELVGSEISKEHMMLLLSVVWLSLTTYAWNDYDAVCAAFYLGIYYLEEALK